MVYPDWVPFFERQTQMSAVPLNAMVAYLLFDSLKERLERVSGKINLQFTFLVMNVNALAHHGGG